MESSNTKRKDTGLCRADTPFPSGDCKTAFGTVEERLAENVNSTLSLYNVSGCIVCSLYHYYTNVVRKSISPLSVLSFSGSKHCSKYQYYTEVISVESGELVPNIEDIGFRISGALFLSKYKKEKFLKDVEERRKICNQLSRERELLKRKSNKYEDNKRLSVLLDESLDYEMEQILPSVRKEVFTEKEVINFGLIRQEHKLFYKNKYEKARNDLLQENMYEKKKQVKLHALEKEYKEILEI
jgi:hypothetical protein